MKKMMKIWNASKLMLAGLILTGLFAACNKDDSPNVRTPAAGFMAFNLSIDHPSVGFMLSGNPLVNTGITYPGYTGNYLPIFVGNREVRSYDFATNNTLAISNETFADSMYYSAFLVGNNGVYENLVVQDDYDNVVPVTGKAWVRYVNAIPDSMAVSTVMIGDASSSANYRTVSSFEQVDAGPLDLSISSGSMINASRTIDVEQDKIYTVLFVGLPNQSDTSKNVAIRYITNGTASN